MRPKPKGYVSNFDAPTIITANPEELANEPPQELPGYERILEIPIEGLNETDGGFESTKDFRDDEIDEGEVQHPYDNLNSQTINETLQSSEPAGREAGQPPKMQPRMVEKPQSHDNSKKNFDDFEPNQKIPRTHKVESKKKFKTANTQKIPDYLNPGYQNREAAPEVKKPRNVKSAKRGSSGENKKVASKIIQNSAIANNQKRSNSNKDRKQKSSPIRTTKISGKNETGVMHYFTSKPKPGSSKGKKQYIPKGSSSGRGKAKATYQEPIHHHANLIKANNLNLSLNNYKTEMQLPNATKYIGEPQFAKSPFLSRTLQGMMQPKPTSKKQASNYGRLGYSFPSKSGRKKREGSAHSNKSKREGSNSHKKSGKNSNKLFNTKKLSFKYQNANQVQNLSDILSKNALNTSKIYSRNDKTMGFSGAGHFLTTGDGMLDKRYSNRAKQPKQTYYLNKKRMNKTMVGSMNKSNHQEYSFGHSASQKRSASGKIKKRNTYAKDNLVRDRHSKDGIDRDLKYGMKSKSQKPKSGRNIFRNTKNTGIYNMTYKKQL